MPRPSRRRRTSSSWLTGTMMYGPAVPSVETYSGMFVITSIIVRLCLFGARSGEESGWAFRTEPSSADLGDLQPELSSQRIGFTHQFDDLALEGVVLLPLLWAV